MPRAGVNAYIVGDVLVDAGMPLTAGRLVNALEGLELKTHVLTHSHGDHAGGSKAVSEHFGLPVWCGARDVDAARRGQAVAASRLQALIRWKPVEVARELHEGDEIGPGFVVLDAPGHSPGQIVLWRERDRTLICADVLINTSFYTMMPGLHEPPGFFTVDPVRNRNAARKIAELEPELVLFGHGQPLRDPAKLARFAQSLPRA